MTKTDSAPSTADIARIVESAHRTGVELDAHEAMEWLAAIAAHRAESDIVIDDDAGVFGHRVTMLDFSPQELERFREIGKLVGFADEPGQVETALALSGSAAQSKIQTHPGDCDYFERINIKADSWEAACARLAMLLRDKALSTASGPTYRLIEVKFGSYPQDVVRDERSLKQGTPIAWSVPEIRAGLIEVETADGAPLTIRWEAVAQDPGWCKLDWLIADPLQQQLTNASNMLDVTWEAPDGTITPLDGYLDPYFQEVYLEAESIPIFSHLARHMSSDALETYVAQLEREVTKYVTKERNYGKAAKRMYNVFRLTGRYEEAAFVRELFDEPATVLYQVWSLIRTIDEAAQCEWDISIESLLAQIDQLILSVVRVLDGEQEVEIVRYLLRLRDSVTWQQFDHEHGAAVEAARAEVINVVNNFFYDRLIALPTIKAYIEHFQG